MGFTFNSATGANYTPVFTEVAKQEVKIAPPEIIYRVEIVNLNKLRDIIKMTLGRSHKRYKDQIKIEFLPNSCRIYFRDKNGDKDFFSLNDVHKKRIAVK